MWHSLPRNAKRLTVLALHAGLTTEEQLRVFEPADRGSRKVVIATNIAEVCAQKSSLIQLRSNSGLRQASVTIEGIKYVIDSGYAKARVGGSQRAQLANILVDPHIQSLDCYVFSHHRTHLTSLGYSACWACGTYFRRLLLSSLHRACIRAVETDDASGDHSD